MSCPHKSKGRCLVAEQLAKLECYIPNNFICTECNRSSSPQRINEVTAGIAKRSLEMAGLEADDNIIGIIQGSQRFGPGTHMKIRLQALQLKFWWLQWNYNYFKLCTCEDWITTMDEWGIPGCLDNSQEILQHFIEEAPKAYPILYLVPKKVLHRYFSNLLFWSLVDASPM